MGGLRTGRKPFLAALAGVAAGALTACNSLGSGSNAGSQPSTDEVNRFMLLSAVLTGYSDLDPEIGTVYLQNIRAQRGPALDDLFKQLGLTEKSSPKSLTDLEKAGAFGKFETLSLVREVLENWYSGTYVNGNATTTATWTQALAWRACSFTKPPSICGAPGSWAKLPV